jgi:hypothetical protein
MNEDYLWDRSGPPDPEIQRLEETLATLRYRPGSAGIPAAVHSPRSTALAKFAAAAVVLAAFGLSRLAAPVPRVTPWQVSKLTGAAQIGSHEAATAMALRTGDLLRTGPTAELSLESDPVGQVDLGPNSQLRATTDRKLLLDRGVLHAFIWARPREFVVDTPSSRAVDLGCEYTINVDASGNGLIRVAMGWVAFQFGGRESFIPAHAACVTRQKQGPGIPFYEDAPEPFRQSLAAFEKGDSAALRTILETARPTDGLTLWHLLTRVSPQDIGAVYDRFAQLVQLPPESTRDAILRREPKAIDGCWNALNLENTDWWRGWERRW